MCTDACTPPPTSHHLFLCLCFCPALPPLSRSELRTCASIFLYMCVKCMLYSFVYIYIYLNTVTGIHVNNSGIYSYADMLSHAHVYTICICARARTHTCTHTWGGGGGERAGELSWLSFLLADNWAVEERYGFKPLEFGRWELKIPPNDDGSCPIQHLCKLKVLQTTVILP